MKISEIRIRTYAELRAQSAEAQQEDHSCSMFCRIPQLMEPGKVIGVFSGGSSRDIILNYLLEAYLFREHNAGHVVLVSSLMDARERMENFIFSMVGISPCMAKHGLKDDKDLAADYENMRAEVEKSDLSVLDYAQIDLDTLIEDLSGGDDIGNTPDVLIVDSLYGCFCGNTRNGALGWSVIGRRLKMLAQLFRCPVVVFCETANRLSSGIWQDGYGSLFSDDNFDICFRLKFIRRQEIDGLLRNYLSIDMLAGAEAVYGTDEEMFFKDDLRLMDLDPPGGEHESIDGYADEEDVMEEESDIPF